MQWLPHAGLLRGRSGEGAHIWSRPAPVLDRALRHAARGLRARPAAALGSLRDRPARARVVEVFAPAESGGDRAGPGAAAVVLPLAAAGLLAAGAAAGVRRGRRRA